MGSAFPTRSRRPLSRVGLWAGLAVAGALGLWSCIDRDNPFDPVNFSPQQISRLKNNEAPFLDSLLNAANALSADLTPLQADWQSRQHLNDSLQRDNAAEQAANTAKVAANKNAEAKNAAAVSADSLLPKTPYDTLAWLDSAGPYPLVAADLEKLSLLQALALGRVDSVNRAYTPMSVYSNTERSGIQAEYTGLQTPFLTFQTQVAASNQLVADTDAVIAAYNRNQQDSNAVLLAYNANLSFHKLSLSKQLATTIDSLRQYVATAQPGDTILIGPGSYSGQIIFPNSGTVDKPIVLLGYPVNAPILSSTPTGAILFLSAVHFIEFHNLVFQQSANDGAKMEDSCSGIVFDSCDFRDNTLHGIEIVDSDVKMRNCRIFRNAENGVQISGLASQVSLDNVLVVHNAGVGIQATSMQGEFQNITVADNGLDGIAVTSPLSPLRISNTIIAFNQGYGISATIDIVNAGFVQTEDCDVYGNTLGLFSIPTASWPSVPIQADPGFTNRDSTVLDYSLESGSAISQLEAQGVIIGYRP